MKYFVTVSAAALLLSACSSTDPTFSSFYSEAGAAVDSGDFGNATARNTLAHRGQLDYAVDLNRRFSAEVDPMINFAFNSATLDAEARATLTEQANWIKQLPEVRFKVYGHTDLVGSASYNRRLGLRRAQAVVSFLTSQGIDRSRLEAVASFGETQPLVVTEGRERRNRRTVTEVSGLVEGNGMLLNGQYAALIYREYVASATAPQSVSGTQISTGTGG